MWQLQPGDEFLKRSKAYEKRHRRELTAVRDNLDTYFKALQEGAIPATIQFGFIHVEPMGVVAIDQKGGGKSLKETRLYVYPEIETQVLYIITIGDKSKHGQQQDIATCCEFVTARRKIVADEQRKQKDVHERAADGSGDVGRPGAHGGAGGEDSAAEDREEAHGDQGE